MAAAARIIYFLQVRSSPFFENPVLDARFFHRLATGEISFPGRAFQWNPLYPQFLETVYTVFGQSPAAALAVQALLGALNAELVFLLAARVFHSRATGVAAGLLAAIYAPFLYYDGLLIAPTITTTLVLGFLLLWNYARGFTAAHFPAGFLLAMASLARGNIVAFLPVAILWPLLFSRGKPLRPRLLAAALLGAGALVPLGVSAARNWAAEGDLVLLTAHGGVNFYVGNGPGATGRYRSVLAGPHGLEGQIAKSRTKAESHAGRPLRSSEVSSYWYGRSFDHMLKAPGSWVLLLCKKTLLLINAWEVPLNYDYEFHKGYASLLRAPLPGFGFVWPLAVMGFILSLTGPRFGTREAAFAGVYGLTLVAFYVSSRYRIPMVAALLPFAGYGLVAGWEALRSMALTRVTLALGAAALAAGVVLVPFPRGEPSASYRALGGIHAAQKNLPAAEKAYRKALAFDPSSSATSNNLANVLRRQGRLPEAEELYRRAVEADPGNAQAWNNLGVCLLDTGDIFGAEEAFLEAREVDGAYLTPLRNLIRLYERNDMTEEARRLREELRRRSGQR